MAELVLEDGIIALAALHNAVVRRVSKGGMVIRGTELSPCEVGGWKRKRNVARMEGRIVAPDCCLQRSAGGLLHVDRTGGLGCKRAALP